MVKGDVTFFSFVIHPDSIKKFDGAKMLYSLTNSPAACKFFPKIIHLNTGNIFLESAA